MNNSLKKKIFLGDWHKKFKGPMGYYCSEKFRFSFMTLNQSIHCLKYPKSYYLNEQISISNSIKWKIH